MLSGCVASTSYEQATSTAEVQLEAHRRTQKKLELLEAAQSARDERLRAALAERDELRAALAAREGDVSEAKLGALTVQKERDQQTDLVTQLRGELARVGSHLETYAGEKSDLAAKLDKVTAERDRLRAENERLQRESVPDEDVGIRPGEIEDRGDDAEDTSDADTAVAHPAAAQSAPPGEAARSEDEAGGGSSQAPEPSD